MLNHWKASMKCDNLNRYIQQTSKEAYSFLCSKGVVDTQISALVKIYNDYSDGLTDFQASRLLGVDASTLSARRNDLTKKYGSHVLVKNGVSSNGDGRRNGIVWKINPFLFKED